MDKTVFNFDYQLILNLFIVSYSLVDLPFRILELIFSKVIALSKNVDCLIHRFRSLLTRALPLVIFVILINVTLFFHSYKFIQILNR